MLDERRKLMSIPVEDIRKSLRISHDMLDTEIKHNIDACLLDLERVGVKKEQESQLIVKACELYCKWQQDYQGKADQYKRNYEELRDAMSLTAAYRS